MGGGGGGLFQLQHQLSVRSRKHQSMNPCHVLLATLHTSPLIWGPLEGTRAECCDTSEWHHVGVVRTTSHSHFQRPLAGPLYAT